MFVWGEVGICTYLFGSNGVFVDAPAVTEAVGQFEDGEDEFSLCGTAFLKTGFEGELLYRGSIGCGCGEVLDCVFGLGFTSPAVTEFVSYTQGECVSCARARIHTVVLSRIRLG